MPQARHEKENKQHPERDSDDPEIAAARYISDWDRRTEPIIDDFQGRIWSSWRPSRVEPAGAWLFSSLFLLRARTTKDQGRSTTTETPRAADSARITDYPIPQISSHHLHTLPSPPHFSFISSAASSTLLQLTTTNLAPSSQINPSFPRRDFCTFVILPHLFVYCFHHLSLPPIFVFLHGQIPTTSHQPPLDTPSRPHQPTLPTHLWTTGTLWPSRPPVDLFVQNIISPNLARLPFPPSLDLILNNVIASASRSLCCLGSGQRC